MTITTTQEQVVCAHCGAQHAQEDTVETVRGQYFCPDCESEHTATCYDCGDVNSIEDSIYVERYGVWVCESCIDSSYNVCAECGEIVSNDDSHLALDDVYCAYCWREHFNTCDCCGEAFRDEDLTDIGDDTLCQACVEERADPRSRILEYHAGVELHFLRIPSMDNSTPNNIYMGVELEIDEGGENHENARQLLDILGDDVHAEHDGSLSNGFELVSQPFTLNYYKERLSQKYKEALIKASEMGYRSHDTQTCGLHVHVGRAGLGASEDEVDGTIAKIWFLMYRFWRELIIFSRRKPGSLERWASAPRPGDFNIENLAEESYESLTIKIKKNGSSVRYRALNLTNSSTIEFRLFRGTLNHDTLTATIQLVHSLVTLAKFFDIEGVKTMSWVEFTYLACVEKPELKEYIKKRGLYYM